MSLTLFNLLLSLLPILNKLMISPNKKKKMLKVRFLNVYTLCILVVYLHDNSILEAWKCKRFKISSTVDYKCTVNTV